MNQRNKKHSLWYSLGLGVLLCIAALVVSTGTTYARYRTERTGTVKFAVQEPEQILLGTLHTITDAEATEELPKGTVVLQKQDTLYWENVDGTRRLTPVIGNGSSEYQYSQRDQQVQLRLLGSLGLSTGEGPVKMYLEIPSEEDPETTESLQAVAVPIEPGTALYYTFGSGWVYTFQGTEGELYWTLPGGAFNTIQLTITMEGVPSQEEAVVTPQITSWVVD